MTELDEYRSRLIARYAGQAQELSGLIAGLPSESITRELEPGGWSAHQVLTHIRDVEAQAFVPRISRILEQNSPKLQSFDPEAWMDQHYDSQEAVGAILSEIQDLRSSASKLIQSLAGEDWNRTGVHPSFGTRTLQWWIEYAVSHFDEHLEQLTKSREG